MAIVIGTNGADDLDGTANNDLIISGNGADTIDAGDGNDLIFSGNGDDTVDAGDGNDVVFAGNGDDVVDGGDGHDLIFGGRGDDTINGGAGNDLIIGGSGDDIIDGGEGCDIVSAGSGNDIVIFDVDENSGAQNYFSGGSGNDTLRLRLTQAQVNEMTAAGVFAAFNAHVGSSGGFDFSSFGLSFAINLKVWRFEQIEVELTSSPGLFTENNDTFDFNTVIAGTYQDGTQYDGLGGDDTVILANDALAAAAAGYVVGTAFNAGAGNDTVTGGTLDDIINGDAGNDVLNGGTGVDVLNGGDDDDRLILEDINAGDSVDGGDGDDTFVFAAANGSGHTISVAANQVTANGTSISVINVENYEISGADMADSLSSTAGKTSFFGLGGNDNIFLTGNNLGDSVDGGDDFDIVFYSDTDALGASLNINNVITVSTTEINVDGTVISLTDVERVVIAGRDGDDMITGSSNNDSLGGNDGNDTINGEGGSDQISGGTGIDNLSGGAGNDSLSLSDISFGDSVDGGADTDTFVFTGSATTDILVDLNAGTISEAGGTVGTISNVESVTSGGGNDTITGDANSNILNGGAGDDDLFGGGGDDVLIGGSGFNRLFAQTGVDTIQGGDDVDQVFIEDLNGDTGDGGADFDSLIFNFATGVNIDLVTGAASLVGGGGSGTFTNFESVVSQGGGATADGTNNRDAFTYNGGGNTINALGGDDEIRVDGAGDAINGGAGFDNLVFQTSDDVTVNLSTGTTDILGTMGTISSIESLTTGSGNDNIIGDANNNILSGGAGFDAIQAGTGLDTIFGGSENDSIQVLDGGDFVDGGAGTNDALRFITAGATNITVDLLNNTTDVDGLAGQVFGIETVSTFALTTNDTMTGTAANEQFVVAGGTDSVVAGAGADSVRVDDGGDFIDGGAGVDAVVVTSSLDVQGNLANGTLQIGADPVTTLVSIERLITGDGDDDLIGTLANDILESRAGNDFINAREGLDIIQAGDGSDFVTVDDLAGDNADGGADFDTIQFVTAQSVNFDLATGIATLVGGGGGGSYVNFEGASIFGPGGATVSGTDGVNNLFVRGTGNTINLLDGADNIDTDMGGNTINGGAGNDSARFNTAEDVTVDLAAGTTSILGVGGLISGIELIRTGAGDDMITGSANNDRVEVGTGADTVSTGLGDDNIFVFDGGDTLDGGGGDNDGLNIVTSDTVVADLSLGTLQIGVDLVSSVTGIENVTVFGSTDATLTGSDGSRDRLIGGGGDDTITSGLVSAGERDALSGGDGDDTFIINGPRVQADGGLGMDTFEFVDYDPGVGTQNALLFDVNIAEMDTINLTSWGLGLTAGAIAALATQGPTANDSNLSLDGGDLTMTIFGINNADLVTFADDIFIV